MGNGRGPGGSLFELGFPEHRARRRPHVRQRHSSKTKESISHFIFSSEIFGGSSLDQRDYTWLPHTPAHGADNFVFLNFISLC